MSNLDYFCEVCQKVHGPEPDPASPHFEALHGDHSPNSLQLSREERRELRRQVRESA